MKVPEPFRQIALLMHQDVFLDVHSEDELFEYLASIPMGKDRRIAVEFINDILSSELTDLELNKIWGMAGADWTILGAREFFERLRDEINRKGSSSSPPHTD